MDLKKIAVTLLSILFLGFIAYIVFEDLQPARDEEPHGKTSSELEAFLPNAEDPKGYQPAPAQDLSSSKKEKPESMSKDVLPNEHVVQFKSASDLKAFVAVAEKNGLTVLGTLDRFKAARLKCKDENAFEELMNKTDGVVRHSLNYATRSPEVPYDQNRTFDLSHYTEFADGALKFLGIRDNSHWGEGVTVAVLDNAVDPHNSFLRNASLDIRSLLKGGAPAPSEESGHGTAVTSIIAGKNIGVSPGSNIMAIQVLDASGSGDTFTLARGIVAAADAGAKVISLSLGTYGNSPILQEAIDYAGQRGAGIIAAAGNDGFDQLAYPARYPNVISVGGVDAAGRHLEFSNEGEGLTFSAPGYGVYSGWSDNQIVSFSGTSAAVPYVSAAVSAILSTDPKLTPQQAVDVLKQTADDRGSPGVDPVYGYGVPDFERIKTRNQPGIYDVAIADQYLQNPYAVDGMVSLAVLIQNRGTEVLPQVKLDVAWNEIHRTFFYVNLGVNQSRNEIVPLYGSAFDPNKPTTVTSTVSIIGHADTRPENNQAISSIRLAK